MRVWDWPIRVCHWGFACSSAGALACAYGFSPESDAFKVHLLLGISAGWFLGVRVVLGFGGSRTVRWRAFFHSPASTARYLADVVRWRETRHEGISPGTSLFAVAVYAGLAGLIGTGFDADWAETWHGRLAYVFMGLIAVHLVGLAGDALRHRRMTPLAMIHGWKLGRPEGEPIRAHWIGGVGLLALSALVTWLVFDRFDFVTAELRLPFLPGIQFPIIQKG